MHGEFTLALENQFAWGLWQTYDLCRIIFPPAGAPLLQFNATEAHALLQSYAVPPEQQASEMERLLLIFRLWAKTQKKATT